MSDYRLVNIVDSASGREYAHFVVRLPQSGVFSELAASVAAHSLFPGLTSSIKVINVGGATHPVETTPDWADHSQPAWRA